MRVERPGPATPASRPAPARTPAPPPDPTAAGGPVRAGVLAAAVLVLGLGGWSWGARLDGAVVAQARVVAGPARQIVQHPEGGRLLTLDVAEGDRVAPGAVLARLDPGSLTAELAIVTHQLQEAEARAARLQAERDDAPGLAPQTGATPQGLAAQAAQARLLAARRATLDQQIAQLRRRQDQSRAQAAGLRSQDAALAQEARLIDADLATAQALRAAGHAQAGRVTALQREAARLAAARAGVQAEAAALDGQVTEIDLQILALRSQRREEAEGQLGDLAPVIVELAARRGALQDRLDRLILRAPAAGRVHGLVPGGPGFVLRPAEPLAEIVPEVAPTGLSAIVAPDQVGRLAPGQAARVRLPGWGGPDPPDLTARLVRLSADAFEDGRTGGRFYTAELVLDPGQPALAARLLRPGEPAEVLIATGSRSPLAWLMAPLTAYFGTALRED